LAALAAESVKMSGWVRYLALTATVKTGLSLQVFVWGPLPLTCGSRSATTVDPYDRGTDL